MERIEPHFFGSSDRRLFGVYHVPRGRFLPHGVVICPPGPQEYMRSHTAIRKLALLLARERFHVLRFDYYGTGDSAGGSRSGSLSEWRENIVAATEDLRESSGVRRISVVGLRLGAALAAAAPVDLVNLILWDPVINGAAYVDELRAIHRRQFAAFLVPPALPRSGAGGDILGSPLPAEMEAELRGIDLLRTPPTRAEHVAVVASEPRPEYTALHARLTQIAPAEESVEFCHIPAEAARDQQDAMLVSSHVLQTMTSVLARRAA